MDDDSILHHNIHFILLLEPFYLPEFYEITQKSIENGKDIEIDKLLPVYNYMTKLFCIPPLDSIPISRLSWNCFWFRDQ